MLNSDWMGWRHSSKDSFQRTKQIHLHRSLSKGGITYHSRTKNCWKMTFRLGTGRSWSGRIDCFGCPTLHRYWRFPSISIKRTTVDTGEQTIDFSSYLNSLIGGWAKGIPWKIRARSVCLPMISPYFVCTTTVSPSSKQRTDQVNNNEKNIKDK